MCKVTFNSPETAIVSVEGMEDVTIEHVVCAESAGSTIQLWTKDNPVPFEFISFHVTDIKWR